MEEWNLNKRFTFFVSYGYYSVDTLFSNCSWNFCLMFFFGLFFHVFIQRQLDFLLFIELRQHWDKIFPKFNKFIHEDVETKVQLCYGIFVISTVWYLMNLFITWFEQFNFLTSTILRMFNDSPKIIQTLKKF